MSERQRISTVEDALNNALGCHLGNIKEPAAHGLDVNLLPEFGLKLALQGKLCKNTTENTVCHTLCHTLCHRDYEEVDSCHMWGEISTHKPVRQMRIPELARSIIDCY